MISPNCSVYIMWQNFPGDEFVDTAFTEKENSPLCVHVLHKSLHRSFHVVVLERKAKQCTRIYNACTCRAIVFLVKVHCSVMFSFLLPSWLLKFSNVLVAPLVRQINTWAVFSQESKNRNHKSTRKYANNKLRQSELVTNAKCGKMRVCSHNCFYLTFD